MPTEFLLWVACSPQRPLVWGNRVPFDFVDHCGYHPITATNWKANIPSPAFPWLSPQMCVVGKVNRSQVKRVLEVAPTCLSGSRPEPTLYSRAGQGLDT